MLRYVLLVGFVFVGVSVGSYFFLPHWFPGLFGPQSHLNADEQLSVLKLLSAAIGSMTTAVVAGGTSVILVNYQLQANKQLEDHKGRILTEIEAKRISATSSLEDKRISATSSLEEKRISATNSLEDKRISAASSLEEKRISASNAIEDKRISAASSLEDKKITASKELDDRKQALGHQLGLERIRIENAHQRIVTLLTAVSGLRIAVNSLARGRFDHSEAIERIEELDKAVDFVIPKAELSSTIQSFRHRARYLIERAENLANVDEQTTLWSEPSANASDGGKALGICFAADAAELTKLLKSEDEIILKGQNT